MSTPNEPRYEAELDELVTGALTMLEQGLPEDVIAELAPERRAAEDTAGPDVGPYHAAAAVLATFDRSTLQPLPDDASVPVGEDDVFDVLADSKPVRDAEGRSRWKLLTGVRRQLLQQLGDGEAIEQALEANPERLSDDPVQSLFEAYVRGTAPPLEEQDVGQLAATFEVAQWLEGVDVPRGSPIPDLGAIRSRTDYLTLLQPFEDLAGSNFAGRMAELRLLREYVGVLPPDSLRTRAVRVAREVFNLTDHPPLVIHGPGGVGKSALIARFIWEHASLPGEQRFPFAYLDFDRATCRPEEPLSLVIEAVRQVGLQYAEARQYADRVRSMWQEELIARSDEPDFVPSAFRPQATSASTEQDWERYVRDFGSFLANVRQGKDPCLFVLDTFEEVQYRGDVVVTSLWAFLQRFQQAVPRLRIVVAGRAPLSASGFPTQPLELGDFDKAAAHVFLERRGVASQELRKTIIKRVGPSPLSLLLAATAVRRAEESGEVEDFDFKGPRGARLTQAQIQGRLYRRILEHIRDPEVASLAYPGLVLRRVTPELIRQVLAEPCEVSVPDDSAAQDLFDRLGREVSLVQRENGALVHRRDVRRTMLPLLRDGQGDSVRRIEDGAIAYYQSRHSGLDRAEEIYHRLSRHEPLDVVADRWSDDAKPYLFNALDENELGARERAWLLPRLDPSRKLDDEERAAADLETWEWDTATKASELLDRNRVQSALQATRARTERSPGSPLYSVEAEALERLGEWAEARVVLEAGIESADEKGDSGLVVDLMTRAGGVNVRLGELDAASKLLAEAAGLLSGRPDDATRALSIGLARFELQRLDDEAGDAPTTLEDVRLQFDRVTDSQLRGNQQLAAWAAADLGPGAPQVFERVIGLLGLPLRPRQLRTLARAIAEWDDAVSQAENRWKGVLGGAALPWAETLTQSWTQLLRELPTPEVGPRIAVLLGRSDVPQDVLEALETVMLQQAAPLVRRETTTERPPAPAAEAPAARDQYADAPFELSSKDAAELERALLDAFPSRSHLATMVEKRLGRSLDSIAFTDDLKGTVNALVRASAQQGWTASLIAAATDSRPHDRALRALAEHVGLVAAAPAESVLKADTGFGASFDVSIWRAQLGTLEAQVCRVGVEGTSFGTGFLIGPDLVLTTYVVVEAVIEGRVSPHAVSLLFDFKSLPGGETVHHGTVYALREADWLVCSSPEGASGLDFALLRLAGTPGSDPIGGDQTEPGALPRGWITPPRRSYAFLPGSPLVVLHHGRAGPLLVAFNSEGVIGLDDSGTRLRYRTDTEPGSMGAPCFDVDWELVALHEGRDASGVNFGVPISMIVRDLEERGLGDVLFSVTV